jgi:glycosyltransferase involved in cell wall biosynthesis
MNQLNCLFVTVIMPVYNGEKFIAEAIKSVINQQYHNLEILVIDDGSTDKTAEVVAQFKDEIQYIYQKNSGPAFARNQGINAAKGELIAFLDCDDLWTENKLTVQVNYLSQHPEIQYVIAKMSSFLEPGDTIPPGFRQELLEKDAVAPIPSTLVVRKSLFDTIGKFNPNLNIADDVDWFARCQDAKIQMSIIDEVLLYKRVHSSNLSLNATNNNQNLLKVLRNSIQRKRQQNQ